MSTTGGDLVVATLKSAGVDTIFGIISVHNIPIYDAIARQGGIRPIMVRHEQGAVSMADGYARATGKLGVAITSTGPGAANGMGAMVEAYWANSPVLHLTGNVERPFIGKEKGFLHEAKDQLTMLRTTTKWAEQAGSTEDIPRLLSEAISQALRGRRRPVALEVPIDTQYFEAEAAIPNITAYPPPRPEPGLMLEAKELLMHARRPLLWAGGGAVAADAGAEVLSMARALGTGVLTSATGRGVISEEDPLCVGNLSLEPAVQALLAEADVLLAVGTRFQGPNTQNWKLPLPKSIIHINIDPDEIGRNYPAAVGLVGDAKGVLKDLLDTLGERVSTDEGWGLRVTQAREEGRAIQRANVGPQAEVMDALRAALPRDAIMVKDATIPAYTWGNRLLEVYEPHTSIHSTSVAIGPGLPLALGAAVGQPERRVALIAGDGGFMLNLGELSTAAQYNLKVTCLVFNDRGYGILRNYQTNNFGGRHIATDLEPVDFAAVAQGMGVAARKVPTKDDFSAAISWALAQPGPTLLDIDLAGLGPMPVRYGGTSRRPTVPQGKN